MELLNAAIEQQKITEQRLRRVAGGADGDSSSSSPAEAAERRAGQILMHLQGKRVYSPSLMFLFSL